MYNLLGDLESLEDMNRFDIDEIMKNMRARICIKEIRKYRGYSQKDLARVMGVAQSTLSSWESGVNTPDAKTLIMLAYILECSLEQLYNMSFTMLLSSSNPYGYDKEYSDLENQLVSLPLSYTNDPNSNKNLSHTRTVDYVTRFKVENDKIITVCDGQSTVPARWSGNIKLYLCPDNCIFGQGILKGSNAIIRCADEYPDGAYVVVAIKDEPVTICRLYYQNNQCTEFILDYCDNNTRPKYFNEANAGNVTILGQILELRKTFEEL